MPESLSRPIAWLRSLLWTVVFSVLGFMLISSLRGGIALPTEAPDFRALTMDAKELRLGDLRGKPTVLYFWASWCGACKLTSPTVDRFAASHPGVNVVGIAMEEEAEARSYLAKNPRHFPVIAENIEIQKAYPVHALPSTVLLDAQGRVLWSRQGVLLPFELEWHLP